MPGVKGMKRNTKVNWDSLDWTKTNMQLGFKHDLSPVYVGLMRRKLGKPKSAYERKSWAKWAGKPREELSEV